MLNFRTLLGAVRDECTQNYQGLWKMQAWSILAGMHRGCSQVSSRVNPSLRLERVVCWEVTAESSAQPRSSAHGNPCLGGLGKFCLQQQGFG